MNRYALCTILAASLLGAQPWDELTAAEDARAARPEQFATIMRYAHGDNVALRRQAVRALGRLERADLADTIAQWLRDPSPVVRKQAAWSIAQANMPNRTPVPSRDIVLAAMQSERDPAVLAALAEALGRVRHADANAARAAATRIAALNNDDAAMRLGVARGLFFIMRQGAAQRAGLDSVKATLLDLATRNTGADSTSLRTRRMATQVLALTRMADKAFAERAFADPDPYVRREAVTIATFATDTAWAVSIAARGLKDSFWRVRYEAVRQYARRAPTASCDDLAPLASDPNIHVRLIALDNLGTGCAATTRTVPLLMRALQSKDSWHIPAHALVALANRDAGAARRYIATFGKHPNFYARTYAANAAGIARDTAALHVFVNDAHPNVRTAAVQALSGVMKHGADDLYLQQLSQSDNQLLLTATAALDSTTTKGVAEKLLDALDRVTRGRTENTRDARDALLKVAGHLGNGALASRVQPYLTDFDPAIANRAADVLKDWTGTRPTPAPNLLPAVPTPTYADAQRMAGERFIVQLANGQTFTLKLLPFEAPTNAARFEQMARSGYFNGITLHRVEPNFVIQGGSRNANEYVGAPRFSRDEIGVPNWRGTVGLSTRGHDTGDAQIYINTIDNELLDPFFTIFAQVVAGMDAVDQMLEGVRISSVRIR